MHLAGSQHRGIIIFFFIFLFYLDYLLTHSILLHTICVQNEEYLDSYGVFLAENGPRDEAVTVLQRAIEVAPDHGFEKYM